MPIKGSKDLKSKVRKLTVGVLGVMIAGAMVPGIWLPQAQAVSGTTPIRVVLSINGPKYNNTYDTVNLAGKLGGLQVGFNGAKGFQPVYETTSTQPIRSSLDNFFIIAGEYSNWPEAVTMAQKLKGAGFSENIFLETRAGKKIYQVVSGYYETFAEAERVAATIQGLGLGKKIAGWYRLQAGSHATFQAAQQQVDTIRNKGFDAYVSARQTADGANSYEVWVGNAASAAERDALKASLAAQGINAAPVSYATNYALFKQDGITDDHTAIYHLFSESTKQELVFQGKGNPGILRFEEKGLSYRGQLIVRGYNKRMAVVNHLPLDDYLKGVVPREMSTGWPLEALKAQAVVARSYAVRQSPDKWGIAQVDDTTWDQAYGGYTWEYDDTNQAVDSTRGQVLMYNNGTPANQADDQIVSTFFSASHGGRSADSSEVWGNPIPYLKPVDSHWDSVSIQVRKEPDWYRVMFASGMIGYVRNDFVSLTGKKNSIGLAEGTIVEDCNIRPLPDVSRLTGRVIGTARTGERVLILEKRTEYNQFAWMRGFSAFEMQQQLGLSSPVNSLQVSETGPSGRVRAVSANGQAIRPATGDEMRAIFGVDNTLFTIEETGKFTVLGAAGRTSQFPDANLQGQNLQTVSGTGTVSPVNGTGDSFLILGAGGSNRVVTKSPAYILWGGGDGHGLGMSQWGAYGMAQEGYTYDKILTHYFVNTYLTPLQ